MLILPLLCWYRQADVNRVTGEENHLGKVHFFCQAAAAGAAAPGASDAPWLFTENETNYTRLYGVSVAHVSVAVAVVMCARASAAECVFDSGSVRACVSEGLYVMVRR